jgi:hypothetical protein
MKPPSWIAVCCAALAAAFALVSFYFAITFRFAAGLQGSPTFTVDQILAALTLMVALVGLIVAVAAIAIGIVAVFGYGEIRQIASRRTDELLKKVIGSLRKRREITAAEAKELWQAVTDEQLAEFEPEAASPTSRPNDESAQAGGGETNDHVDKYPSGERRDNEESRPIPTPPK